MKQWAPPSGKKDLVNTPWNLLKYLNWDIGCEIFHVNLVKHDRDRSAGFKMKKGTANQTKRFEIHSNTCQKRPQSQPWTTLIRFRIINSYFLMRFHLYIAYTKMTQNADGNGGFRKGFQKWSLLKTLRFQGRGESGGFWKRWRKRCHIPDYCFHQRFRAFSVDDGQKRSLLRRGSLWEISNNTLRRKWIDETGYYGYILKRMKVAAAL